ncbi:MAG: flagellar basal body rod protein FlgB [bacterium]|nr:flagellar basal body rod protein FlgB [bacterium]
MNIQRPDSMVNALHTTLAKTSRRSEVAASNLANVDTPGYRSLEVRFDDVLSLGGGLRRTDGRHLQPVRSEPHDGTLVDSPATRIREDGNTVNIDRTMTQLTLLQGRYRASAELLRKRFALLTYAVTDGRSSR